MPSTSASTAMEAVVHYKKKLMRHVDDPDPDVMLHCLNKLDRVPMTIDILQETGVGRIVNSLKKKMEPDSEVAVKAKTMIKKWKDIVANHEEMEEQDVGDTESVDNPDPIQSAAPDSPPPEEERKRHKDRDSSSRHHHKKHKDKDKNRSESHSSSSSSKKRKKDKKDSKHHKDRKHESKSKLSAFDAALVSSSKSKSTAAPPLVDIPMDINPNYKPAPSYNIHPDYSSRHQPNGSLSKRTEDEQLSALMSKKGTRNMMYSGVRRSAFKGVPSLQDLCIHLLQEKVDYIEQCGGLPFEILEPILVRASPATLMNIEEFNQYLMEKTGPLWERHCKKQFPKEQREEFESFREMFERCSREREEKLERLTAKMGSRYKMEKESARKTKMAYVGTAAKPPRNVKKAQERDGTPNVVPSNSSGQVKRGRPPLGSGGGGSGASAPKKPKIAPMMAKTLKLARGLKGGFRR